MKRKTSEAVDEWLFLIWMSGYFAGLLALIVWFLVKLLGATWKALT